MENRWEDNDMKRMLAAACAALLLAGSLTACGSRTSNGATNNGAAGNGTTGSGVSPSGTAYTAPGQVRYPAGAAEDRTSYNRMTTNRSQYSSTSDGRYTAYSDGTVSPGHGAIARDNRDLGTTGNTTSGTQNNGTLAGDVARGAGDLVRGAGNAVADVGNGIGSAARDLTR